MQQPSPGPSSSPSSDRAGDSAGARPRFPFPSLPKGWFVVALSTDVEVGQIVPLHYFGRDLIAFRGESGEAHVVGAYCPHLGANLAHGGSVEDDCVRCPYHGWRFDGEGACVEVPYADKIPPKAKLDALPVREQDGCIFVFYSPAPLAADEPWPLPALELDGMSPAKVVQWKALRTHAQEVFENTVDIAHISPVHDGRDARVLGDPVRDGVRLAIDLEFVAPGDVVDMPGTFNDVHLHVELLGLGHVVVRTHVRNVDVRACQRIYATPVDDASIDLRGIVHVRETEDPEFSAELAEIFFRAYAEDFARDFPIWENKRYVERPALAKGDGPIGLYRRWCRQFYVEPVEPVEPVGARSGEADPARASARAALTPAAALLRRLRPLGARVLDGAGVVAERVPWLGDLVAPLLTRAAPDLDLDGSDLEDPAPSASPARKSSERAPSITPRLRVDSAAHYVETLPQRFVARAARGVDAVFQWELTGPAGLTFHAKVTDGALDIIEGPHARPTTTLVIGAQDYVRVVNGELDGMRVFTSGKGKVKGSIKAAMSMRAIFPLD